MPLIAISPWEWRHFPPLPPLCISNLVITRFQVILWGNTSSESKGDSWQSVTAPLDVGEPATAVDFAPLVKESR